jgi:hypothetical protein
MPSSTSRHPSDDSEWKVRVVEQSAGRLPEDVSRHRCPDDRTWATCLMPEIRPDEHPRIRRLLHIGKPRADFEHLLPGLERAA